MFKTHGDTKQRFSFRKSSLGVASVLIASFFLGGEQVMADDFEPASPEVVQVSPDSETVSDQLAETATDTEASEALATDNKVSDTAETSEVINADKPVDIDLSTEKEANPSENSETTVSASLAEPAASKPAAEETSEETDKGESILAIKPAELMASLTTDPAEAARLAAEAALKEAIANAEKPSLGTVTPVPVSSATGIVTRSDNGWRYFPTEEGKRSEYVEVPEGVTEIGYRAFAGSSVREVRLPSTLKKLDLGAFTGSTKLERINLPEGLEDIAQEAFFGTKNLTEITLPESITEIGHQAFYGSGLKKIELPKNVKRIRQSAFEYSALESIDLPQGLELIENQAFSHTQLNRISIPEGVTEIPEYAFRNSQLREIELPKTLKYIRQGAFIGSQLEKINLPEALEIMPELLGVSNLKEVIIQSRLKTLKKRIFFDSPIEKITFPEGLESIEEGAINLSKVTELILPDGFKRLGKTNLESLRKISLPESLSTSERGISLSGAKNIEVVEFRGNWLKIPSELFSGTRVKNLILPETIKTIDRRAFEGAELPETFRLPEGVEEIGTEAFAGVALPAEFRLPMGVAKIGNSAFANADLPDIFELPAGVVSVGDKAFKGASVEEIVLPSTLKSLGFEAFADSSIKRIILPEGLEAFGRGAFKGSMLRELTILGDGRGVDLSGASKLKNVTLPKSYSEREWGSSPFSEVEQLEEVKFSGNWESIPSRLFLGTRLNNLTLSPTISHIGRYAFSGSTVNSLIVPEGTMEFNYPTIANELNGTKVYLPNSLQKMDFLPSRIDLMSFNAAKIKPATIAESQIEFHVYENSDAHRYLQSKQIPFILRTEGDQPQPPAEPTPVPVPVPEPTPVPVPSSKADQIRQAFAQGDFSALTGNWVDRSGRYVQISGGGIDIHALNFRRTQSSLLIPKEGLQDLGGDISFLIGDRFGSRPKMIPTSGRFALAETAVTRGINPGIDRELEKDDSDINKDRLILEDYFDEDGEKFPGGIFYRELKTPNYVNLGYYRLKRLELELEGDSIDITPGNTSAERGIQIKSEYGFKEPSVTLKAYFQFEGDPTSNEVEVFLETDKERLPLIPGENSLNLKVHTLTAPISKIKGILEGQASIKMRFPLVLLGDGSIDTDGDGLYDKNETKTETVDYRNHWHVGERDMALFAQLAYRTKDELEKYFKEKKSPEKNIIIDGLRLDLTEREVFKHWDFVDLWEDKYSETWDYATTLASLGSSVGFSQLIADSIYADAAPKIEEIITEEFPKLTSVVTAFYNKIGKQAIIAFRGSDEGDLEVKLHNSFIALSAEDNPQMRIARHQVQKLLETLKDYAVEKLYITGHSLGGYLAFQAAVEILQSQEKEKYPFTLEQVHNFNGPGFTHNAIWAGPRYEFARKPEYRHKFIRHRTDSGDLGNNIALVGVGPNTDKRYQPKHVFKNIKDYDHMMHTFFAHLDQGYRKSGTEFKQDDAYQLIDHVGDLIIDYKKSALSLWHDVKMSYAPEVTPLGDLADSNQPEWLNNKSKSVFDVQPSKLGRPDPKDLEKAKLRLDINKSRPMTRSVDTDIIQGDDPADITAIFFIDSQGSYHKLDYSLGSEWQDGELVTYALVPFMDFGRYGIAYRSTDDQDDIDLEDDSETSPFEGDHGLPDGDRNDSPNTGVSEPDDVEGPGATGTVHQPDPTPPSDPSGAQPGNQDDSNQGESDESSPPIDSGQPGSDTTPPQPQAPHQPNAGGLRPATNQTVPSGTSGGGSDRGPQTEPVGNTSTEQPVGQGGLVTPQPAQRPGESQASLQANPTYTAGQQGYVFASPSATAQTRSASGAHLLPQTGSAEATSAIFSVLGLISLAGASYGLRSRQEEN